MTTAQPRRGAARRLLVAALLAAGLVAAPAAAASAQTGSTTVAGPGVDLRKAFERLRPGDTLELEPGTYTIGYIRPVVARGTKAQPITVRAADPARPPLLRGGILLKSPDFWRLERLRVEATAPKAPALHVFGGNGWAVLSGEYFGARNTDAYANVAIEGTGGYPRGFRFAGNCVHDAGRSERIKTDHNMYVSITGDTGSGGVIEHNTIYGHPNGAGIKLGGGGQPGIRGPWGVTVENNTIVWGGRQILMSQDIRNNVVSGNLLGASTEPFSATDRRTTGVYALGVEGTGNLLEHNYVFGASMPYRDPNGLVRVGADVGLRPDPRLSGLGTCSVQPTYWKAKYYGRTSTEVYQQW